MTRPFKIIGINHIGIAAKDPERAFKFFSEDIGAPFIADELVKEQNTLTRMFESSATDPSDSLPRIELLEIGASDQLWPISNYMEKKGGGIHHIALTVTDLTAAIGYLKSKSVAMIDEIPRKGAHDTDIAFIHPKSTGGILVELVQQK